jgi:hypothetical protein
MVCSRSTGLCFFDELGGSEMTKAILIAISLFGLLTVPAFAADVGRYQAIPLAKSTSLGGEDAIMILDTQTGDFWEWFSAPGIGKNPPVTGITYMGKVTPGNSPGETTTIQRFVPKSAFGAWLDAPSNNTQTR